jgi:hypothetical protein
MFFPGLAAAERWCRTTGATAIGPQAISRFQVGLLFACSGDNYLFRPCRIVLIQNAAVFLIKGHVKRVETFTVQLIFLAAESICVFGLVTLINSCISHL